MTTSTSALSKLNTMLGVAPGPEGAGGGGSGAGGGGSGGRTGPTESGGGDGGAGGGGVCGDGAGGGGVAGSVFTSTRGGGGLGGIARPEGPEAQAESVTVVARSSARRRRLVIALAGQRAATELRGNRGLLSGRRARRRRRHDLHRCGRRRLHERPRLHGHRSGLAGGGEWLTWHELSRHRLPRNSHGGVGWRGCHRARLARILEEHFDEALGPRDHHAIVGDLLDLPTADGIADRVAANPLDRRIFEEGATLAALDHDAVEDRLHHRHGGRRRRRLAAAGIEEVLRRDRRVRLGAGTRGGRRRHGRRGGDRSWHGRLGHGMLDEERAHDAREEEQAHEAERNIEYEEAERQARHQLLPA